MEAEFQEVVRELTAKGRTVLLSSHILAQVESLADRISIIRDGKTVEAGSLDDLRHMSRTSITVTTEQPLDRLATLPGVHGLTSHNGHSQFDVDRISLDSVIRELSTFGVLSLEAKPPTLEQLLLRHYSDQISAETRQVVLGDS